MLLSDRWLYHRIWPSLTGPTAVPYTHRLILQLQCYDDSIDVRPCRSWSIVQVLSVERACAADVASPIVRRNAGIVAGDDIVHTCFIFLAVTGELTVKAGISRIGLKPSDPDLLRKQIQGIRGP